MPLPHAARALARRTALTLTASLLLALAAAGVAQAAAIDIAPAAPVAGEQVTFTASGEPDEVLAGASWSVPERPDLSWPPGRTASATFAAGTYTVVLTGPESTFEPVSKVFTVAPPGPPDPPTVTISPAGVDLKAGEAGNFTATATNHEGEISWSTGSADAPVEGTGPSFTRSFETTTTVWARATGPGGTAVAQAEARVVVPSAKIELDAQEPVLQNEQIVLRSASTDPDGDEADLEYDWDLPNEAPDEAYGDPAEVSVTFSDVDATEVTLRVRDAAGHEDETTRKVDVSQGVAPVADFEVDPAVLLPGMLVTFISTATDADDNLFQYSWDFGQGFVDGGPLATASFPAPGSYLVGHRVTDLAGLAHEHFDTVTVSPPPTVAGPTATAPAAPAGSAAPPVTTTGGAPAGRPPGPVARPTLMAPFPVVRIAGSVFRRSARIRVLSVVLPRGARAEVRCRGRRCPAAVQRKSAPTRGRGSSATVRFSRFEGRSLPAGTTLSIRVTKPGTIGKFTRFRIRAGRAPSRVDRCVMPGSTRPVACPGA